MTTIWTKSLQNSFYLEINAWTYISLYFVNYLKLLIFLNIIYFICMNNTKRNVYAMEIDIKLEK